MHALTSRLGPSATDMIRADHTRVLALFHRYALDSRPRTKRALAGTICLGLEVHAQVEEEIFYPAMLAAGSTEVEKSVPEHEEMRSLIRQLRQADPASGQFDLLFMELMRCVIHHVADEETVMLPHAESLLGGQLGVLGTRMAKRRMQLKAARSAEMAANAARGNPLGGLLVAAAAVAAGAYFYRNKGRTFRRLAA